MDDILKIRRSVRQFSELPVSEEDVNRLVDALLRAPSSRSRKPCRFVVVRNAETRQKLSTAKAHGAGFLAGAPVNIVIAGDTAVSDAWIEDASIAAITAQYAAVSLGLGSCWAQIRMRQREDGTDGSAYVKRLLEMPDSWEVQAVIGIGHPAEMPPAHGDAVLDKGSVSVERAGVSFFPEE